MGMMLYTFQRAEGFYPIEFSSDKEALKNVECNPGTLKVVNQITGETIYNLEKTNDTNTTY